MNLDLGHNHPDHIYSNDQLQAKLTLALSAAMAVLIVLMIVMTIK